MPALRRAPLDPHTLLCLQLEWIHHEHDGIAQLAGERLEAYNLVLKEEVTQLELELAVLRKTTMKTRCASRFDI